jgi:peptide/nickel transport system substrate-binding protein
MSAHNEMRTIRTSRREFLKLASLATAGAVAAPALSLDSASAAVLAEQRGSPEKPRTVGSRQLVIGIAGDPSTLDPGFGQQSLANEIIKNTYAQWTRYPFVPQGNGVLKADTTRTLGDALASYTVSPDGTTVHCTVRPMKFPSGDPFTADDFIYTVKRALGLDTGPVFDFNIIGISSVSQITKQSPMQFTMKLDHPSPILGPMLRDQDAGVLDAKRIARHATSSDPWATKWMADHSLGGGAYTVAEYTPGTGLTLKANPNYWEPAPYFQTIVLQEIPSSDERVLFLERGAIDIAEDLSLSTARRLAGKPGVRLFNLPSRLQDMFGLVETHIPFHDVRVRQAIAYAIPYEALSRDVLYGYSSVPKAVWPQNSTSFAPDETWPYTTNMAKARALLDAAGYSKGFSFTVETSTDDADASALAVQVQSALRHLGITMNISSLAPAVFQEHLSKKTMAAWIQSGLGDYVDDPYYHLFLWFTSKSVLNWFAFSNAEIDRLASQLATELNPAERQVLAARAQRVLNEQVPVIILAEPHFVLPTRSDVSGLVLEPDYLLRYNRLRRV